MKIVFFGTPQFAADVLSYLLNEGISIQAVITKPDKPKGRSGLPQPTPVKKIAQEHQLPLYQPEIVSSPDFAPILKTYEADLFVVVAYGEILKPHLLEMPKLGCINLHASLLPKYRGAAPIQQSIIQGETETGVTIMHMAKKMDAGDIIKMVSVPITQETTYGELEQTLLKVGSKALLDVVKEFELGTPARIEQDHSKATFAPKIELENCEVNWQKPAQEIHNLIRGVFPHPGAWCYVTVRNQKLRLKIYKTKVVEGEGQPGQLLHYGKEGLVVATGKGAIQILELQLEGKKSMLAEDLMRGVNQFSFTT